MLLNGIYTKTIRKNNGTYMTRFELSQPNGNVIKCIGECPSYELGTPLELEVKDEPDANGFYEILSLSQKCNNDKVLFQYLKSSIFGNISTLMASKIVAMLDGRDIFEFSKSETAVEQLMKCTKKKEEWADLIITKINNSYKQKVVIDKICAAGGSVSDAIRIYGKYGTASIKRLETKPYSLFMVKGISFNKCDILAKHHGIEANNYEREVTLISYALHLQEKQGNTCCTFKTLYKTIFSIMKNSAFPDHLLSELEILRVLLLENSKFIIKENLIYNKNTYYQERAIAINVKRLKNHAKKRNFNLNYIAKIESLINMQFDDSQKNVFNIIPDGGIAVLTGAPGCGKTSTIKGLISGFTYIDPGIKIGLMATTGCAAQRMEEATGMYAETVNKGLKPSPETMEPTINENNQFDYDVIIVDEISMADTKLMSQFLKGVKSETVIILVGDADQLKSVGPGRVLNDLIESGYIPVYRLLKIHRQANGSVVPENAALINEGNANICPDNNSLYVYNFNTVEETEVFIEKLYYEYLKNIPVTDFNILSVTKQTSIGTEAINNKLHTYIYGNKEGYRYNKYVFCKGERVMLTDNNYDIGYCNGDTGFVDYYDDNGLYIVLDNKKDDEEKTIYVSGFLVDDVIPAYAKTVHKAQGSEAPIVVMVVPDSMPYMLCRNILYTGMTRAKQQLIILAVGDSIQMCAENKFYRERTTGLKQRLKEA